MDISQNARKQAEKKLGRIISLHGDAGGERRKPYYLEKLVEEETTAICLRIIGMEWMELLNAEIAPVALDGTGATDTN